MLGMSNAMYDEDKMINGNQNHTEQEHKKDWQNKKQNTLHNTVYKKLLVLAGTK
jgi:hypothetical protein